MYAAIYCRKSVDTGRGASMQSQLSYCMEYLTVHRNAELAKSAWLYQDEGFSGAALERPAMQRLLTDVRARLISCVVCYRLDRISRSVADFTSLMEEFSRYHVDFLCASEEFDTAKPMGRAMLYIASVFSQLERETLAERVRDNMYTLAQQGHWLGGPPPYGYRILRTAPPHPYSTLIPEEGELSVVRRMFSLYLTHHSIEQVTEALLDVKNREGKPFSPRLIRSILRNPLYTAASALTAEYLSQAEYIVGFSSDDGDDTEKGILVFGKHPNHGTAKPLAVRGSHTARIPDCEWLEVQKTLAVRKKKRLAPEGMLRQYLFCGRCGAEMYPKRRSGRVGQFDYICKRKMREKGCACENVNGTEADVLAWESICDALGLDTKAFGLLGSERRALCALCVKSAEWDGTTLRIVLHTIGG